jgi:hypothetical protein
MKSIENHNFVFQRNLKIEMKNIWCSVGWVINLPVATEHWLTNSPARTDEATFARKLP